MRRLIVASNNAHKVEEIKEMLNEFSFEVLSLKEAGIDIDVEENGSDFIENAEIKARAIKELVGDSMVLSDDSGLAVDALGGAPGIYSARYAGEHGNSEKNNIKLIQKLEGVETEKRGAKFVCAMVLIIDDENIIKVQGEAEGRIIEEYKGQNGFGYDPLFYVDKYKMTFAEMSSDLKNSISHRANAFKLLKEKLGGVEE